MNLASHHISFRYGMSKSQRSKTIKPANSKSADIDQHEWLRSSIRKYQHETNSMEAVKLGVLCRNSSIPLANK